MKNKFNLRIIYLAIRDTEKNSEIHREAMRLLEEQSRTEKARSTKNLPPKGNLYEGFVGKMREHFGDHEIVSEKEIQDKLNWPTEIRHFLFKASKETDNNPPLLKSGKPEDFENFDDKRREQGRPNKHHCKRFYQILSRGLAEITVVSMKQFQKEATNDMD